MNLNVNPPGYGTVAPHKNVSTAMSVAQRLIDRPIDAEGFGVFFGPSGYGKSMASIYVQNKTRAIYLEVFDYWSKKKFCQALLAELGVDKARGTVSDLMDQALRILQDDPNRLLIIDEADKLVDKGMIELARDLSKGARLPILLVGEEKLPQKLATYERCENRVIAFGMANPSDIEDTRAIAAVHHRWLTIEDDLLALIVERTKGNARRIGATLAEVGQVARANGVTSINAEGFTGQIFTGQAPRRGAR